MISSERCRSHDATIEGSTTIWYIASTMTTSDMVKRAPATEDGDGARYRYAATGRVAARQAFLICCLRAGEPQSPMRYAKIIADIVAAEHEALSLRCLHMTALAAFSRARPPNMPFFAFSFRFLRVIRPREDPYGTSTRCYAYTTAETPQVCCAQYIAFAFAAFYAARSALLRPFPSSSPPSRQSRPLSLTPVTSSSLFTTVRRLRLQYRGLPSRRFSFPLFFLFFIYRYSICR